MADYPLEAWLALQTQAEEDARLAWMAQEERQTAIQARLALDDDAWSQAKAQAAIHQQTFETNRLAGFTISESLAFAEAERAWAERVEALRTAREAQRTALRTAESAVEAARGVWQAAREQLEAGRQHKTKWQAELKQRKDAAEETEIEAWIGHQHSKNRGEH